MIPMRRAFLRGSVSSMGEGDAKGRRRGIRCLIIFMVVMQARDLEGDLGCIYARGAVR